MTTARHECTVSARNRAGGDFGYWNCDYVSAKGRHGCRECWGLARDIEDDYVMDGWRELDAELAENDTNRKAPLMGDRMTS
ncbi:MAG TPA: hypothetical protein VMX12_00125 [Acidimicrobiia bacterium]|nr:hypothetical protein [Acidimicrobiia bacterium]